MMTKLDFELVVGDPSKMPCDLVARVAAAAASVFDVSGRASGVRIRMASWDRRDCADDSLVTLFQRPSPVAASLQPEQITGFTRAIAAVCETTEDTIRVVV